ncbi:MAG: flavodoxin domain-containing protein [Zhengella sp.]|uniref:flavodoxin domain-containing protein n=1 Tax=Zhengella sp. TaxID=2282762 RepID=UPI001DBBB580|nr:flavodoxin domain-containing protein [Notoacmeibacter sp.]MCC0028281.1 flavodoxin domain-containing protein [Brucellaceae bacterium]
MHVIVIYATVEGQTRKIARHVAGTVQSLGHDVTVYDAADLEDVDVAMADALIAAAPIHIGRFPAPFVQWIADHANALNGRKTAFVSVSLGMASQFEAEKREVAAMADAFFAETGWHPAAVHHAAGALRYTKYDFLKRLLMRHIAAKEGGDVDTSEDHEYTDWEALAAFVQDVLAD